jgi:hypothetical protein
LALGLPLELPLGLPAAVLPALLAEFPLDTVAPGAILPAEFKPEFTLPRLLADGLLPPELLAFPELLEFPELLALELFELLAAVLTPLGLALVELFPLAFPKLDPELLELVPGSLPPVTLTGGKAETLFPAEERLRELPDEFPDEEFTTDAAVVLPDWLLFAVGLLFEVWLLTEAELPEGLLPNALFPVWLEPPGLLPALALGRVPPDGIADTVPLLAFTLRVGLFVFKFVEAFPATVELFVFPWLLVWPAAGTLV